MDKDRRHFSNALPMLGGSGSDLWATWNGSHANSLETGHLDWDSRLTLDSLNLKSHAD